MLVFIWAYWDRPSQDITSLYLPSGWIPMTIHRWSECFGSKRALTSRKPAPASGTLVVKGYWTWFKTLVPIVEHLENFRIPWADLKILQNNFWFSRPATRWTLVGLLVLVCTYVFVFLLCRCLLEDASKRDYCSLNGCVADICAVYAYAVIRMLN